MPSVVGDELAPSVLPGIRWMAVLVFSPLDGCGGTKWTKWTKYWKTAQYNQFRKATVCPFLVLKIARLAGQWQRNN